MMGNLLGKSVLLETTVDNKYIDILNAIRKQFIDGIWSIDNKRLKKYVPDCWYNSMVFHVGKNGKCFIEVPTENVMWDKNGRCIGNVFARKDMADTPMDIEDIMKELAILVKKLAKTWLEDNGADGIKDWKRKNSMAYDFSDYAGNSCVLAVSDLYRVYDNLNGRNI